MVFPANHNQFFGSIFLVTQQSVSVYAAEEPIIGDYYLRGAAITTMAKILDRDINIQFLISTVRQLASHSGYLYKLSYPLWSQLKTRGTLKNAIQEEYFPKVCMRETIKISAVIQSQQFTPIFEGTKAKKQLLRLKGDSD